MRNAAEDHDVCDALERLGSSPLDQADDDALVSLANALWYEHSSLDRELRRFLDHQPDEIAARRVGYLVEKLTRFSCVTDDRAAEALDALGVLAGQFPRCEEVRAPAGTRLRELRDELARSWGLTEGLGAKVQTLLPYQTRHYAAGRNTAFD